MKNKIYGVIYKVVNKINNKVYIGKTSNKNGFDGRYRGKGFSDIEKFYNTRRREKRSNDELINDIEQYGFENFEVYKNVDYAFSKEELNIKERVYINIYKKNIYNQELYEYNFNNHKEYIRIKIRKEDLETVLLLLKEKNIYVLNEK